MEGEDEKNDLCTAIEQSLDQINASTVSLFQSDSASKGIREYQMSMSIGQRYQKCPSLKRQSENFAINETSITAKYSPYYYYTERILRL